MGRFAVMDYEEAKRFDDPEGWLDFHFHNEWDYPGYLVDTEVGVVVFCDSMEPEDATLGRALQPLIRYMEEVAK